MVGPGAERRAFPGTSWESPRFQVDFVFAGLAAQASRGPLDTTTDLLAAAGLTADAFLDTLWPGIVATAAAIVAARAPQRFTIAGETWRALGSIALAQVPPDTARAMCRHAEDLARQLRAGGRVAAAGSN